ncbi:MAG: FHA domain-containing protein, partial [Myxococcaceae bacterium]
MWQIVISGPGYFDTQYDLPEGTTTLGRADENDIVLSGDLVSRKHARIHVERDRISAEDLGSRNGTKRNGQPFQKTVELRRGDLLTVGENVLQVRLVSATEVAKTEMVSGQQAEGVVRFGQGMDIEASVILAKNVRESMAYRLLDNVVPFESPFEDTLPPEAVLKPTSPLISYDSLLLLYQTAQRLASAETLTHFLESTVDRLMANVNATTAVVLLRHVTGQLTPAVVRHRGQLGRGEVPVSDAIIDAALSQGAALAVRDVQADSRFSGRESVLLYHAAQVLCVPIGEKP